MIGSGGRVDPVICDPAGSTMSKGFAAGAPSRAFGAGRGIGTACASADGIKKPTVSAAASQITPVCARMRIGRLAAGKYVTCLLNALSCSARCVPFTALCSAADIAFSRARSGTTDVAALEHFPAKWNPVSRKKMLSINNLRVF